MKDYKFQYKTKNTKEFGKLACIILADKTELIFHKKGMVVKYPKRKFKPIFEEQFHKKYIAVEFTITEMKAILKGLEFCQKDLKKKLDDSNETKKTN